MGLIFLEGYVYHCLRSHSDAAAGIANEREFENGVLAAQLKEIVAVFVGVHAVGRTFFDDACSDDGVSGGIFNHALDCILLGQGAQTVNSECKYQNNSDLPPEGGVKLNFIILVLSFR